jgi:hypothetical protein
MEIFITNGNGQGLDPQTAVRNAIYYGKVVEKSDGSTFALPSGQQAGTETQKVSYAEMKALQITKSKSFKKWLNH